MKTRRITYSTVTALVALDATLAGVLYLELGAAQGFLNRGDLQEQRSRCIGDLGHYGPRLEAVLLVEGQGAGLRIDDHAHASELVVHLRGQHEHVREEHAADSLP